MSAVLLIALLVNNPQGFDAAALARTAADDLANGRHAEFLARASSRFKAAMPEPALAELARRSFASAGAFEAIEGEPSCGPVKDMTYCVVVLRFAERRVSLRLSVNGAGQIGGMQVVGSELRTERVASALRIDAGRWSLPAFLTLPDGPGPFPVLVLVHGSGAHDADETVGPNKPFADLAAGLATRGVGTLRYYKRWGVTSLPPTATLNEETIDDALAAVELARRQPRVDPGRVFVLGHSLGGYLAPYIASRNSSVRGIVIMAGSNRPMRDVVAEQVKHITGSDAALETVWQSLPQRYKDGLPDYDPLATVASLRIPVLVLQGGRDYQVRTVDFDRWKTALAGRDATFRLYPALNHLFLSGTGSSTPAEYQVAGHIPGEVIDDIASWVRTQLRIPNPALRQAEGAPSPSMGEPRRNHGNHWRSRTGLREEGERGPSTVRRRARMALGRCG